MRARTQRVHTTGLLAGVLAAVLCPACGAGPRPGRGRDIPEAAVAHQAVEKALRAWQDSPEIERTTTAIRPIMFVEQQQPTGQRLLKFDILGETPGYEDEGFRRFLVRLSLADPEASVVAAYNVFGRSPVWVYRVEDFDMIMHMDHSMMSTPPSAGGEGAAVPRSGKRAASTGPAPAGHH